MRVTFYFPFKVISGVPILFANMANELSKLKYDVSVVDYYEGILWKHSNNSVKKIRFEDGKKIILNDDSFLIMQAITLNSMRPELQISENQNILFWQLHPNNFSLNNIFKISQIDKVFNLFRFNEKNKIKKTLKEIDRREGLIYMDGANYNNTQELYSLKLKKKLLPIIIDETRKFDTDDLNNDKINISYVGRISDFKYFPLLKLIEQIDVLVLNKKIDVEFFVIGDGEFKETLIERTKRISFKINFIGSVDNKNLLSTLCKYKININFAMGTSVLDSAFVGIPSVVLNFFYENMKNTPKYQWIYEETDFSVGKELFNDDFTIENFSSLEKIFNDLINNNKIVVNKTKDFYKNNYNVFKVINQFINFLNISNLQYKHVQHIHKKGTVRKIYNYINYGLK